MLRPPCHHLLFPCSDPCSFPLKATWGFFWPTLPNHGLNTFIFKNTESCGAVGLAATFENKPLHMPQSNRLNSPRSRRCVPCSAACLDLAVSPLIRSRYRKPLECINAPQGGHMTGTNPKTLLWTISACSPANKWCFDSVPYLVNLKMQPKKETKYHN